ncbi:microtubule-actin cross-linking factor 1 isoform X5 [Pelobates cultripes]|uniref:Microtubule-actin cross-linking factor 1 isoform X5 n=1 Tax=Pelobates cultripes TaxID=61616 RepID=A0AAD1VMQ4_PELCU|nr:microtubule-actin cross-linking factor 1 isoform X5 [Pelobates cultripes]
MSSSDEETLSERSYRSERSCRSERSGSLSPCPPGDTLPWNLPRHEQKKRQSKDSVLDPAERAVVRVADERDRVQKKTFTKWVNKHLIKVRKHINDLYEDLRDGHNLISLLEVLSGVRLPREKGRMRFHRLQNVQIALDFLKQRQVKLVNIRNDDITDGNPKLTLGLIWTIILHFQISEIYVSGESGDMSAKEKLLLWTQKVTAGYTGVKCTNFSASWRDGKMFNAIIHRYRPDLVDMQKVNIQSNQENLEQAFEIAESLGVTRLLDAEDVDVDSPDEKSVITYVSSIYDVFPKVPEGTEGISATEVDSYWLEYQERIVSLTQWIRQHVLLMSDKSFPQNPVELKALYNQYVHVKETEIPVKEQEKGHIQKLYQMLQPWIEFGRLKLPPLCHPNDVEEQWGKLILSMLEREKVLRPAVERLELLLQIANRIQNGCLSCEEKLTLARNTLQSDADNVECGQRVQQEIEVVQFLQESEGLLRQLQADVQILRDEKYFQVEELAFRVLRIQDELFSLRLECTNLYRRGNFSNSDLQPSISENTSLQQTLHTTHTSSTSWFRKPMSRMELVALSSSEDEGSLRFVYELLAWVEEMQMKLERAEWGNDLPSVEAQLENQRQVHNSVEELALSLREARSYEVKMSPNFRSSYRETLNKLEIQYSKLGETSSSRLHHLQSLHDFVSRATAQIIWLNEKEEEELAYDWSDLNSNMAAKKDYFNKLTQELDEKQDVIQSLQETAEMLSLKNHPAKQTVEAYSAAVLSQWQWVQQLCLCVEQHVKENSAYFQFFSDVHESEVYLRNMQDSIKRKYSCDRSTSVNRLEDMLQDSMDEKEQLIQSRTTVASLVGRSKYIVQLKPRNPEYGLSGTLPIRAICDYRQIEITINRNEECVLEDHSQRTKWKVISTTGNEAMVPSVCFLIPSPNKEAIDLASRVEQLYQKVMSLWHQLHVNTKSLISWHYLRKDLDVAQSWNIEKLRVLPLAERLQTLSSLHSHLDDFLEDSKDSQIFSQTDRLSLEQEVESCKEQCRKLVDLIETEDKDESVAQTYLSELHNIRLHLDDCEQRIVKRLQSPSSSDADAVHENTVHIAEQEKMQEELKRLKSELSMVSDRCDHFLHKSPSASSTPNVRSQLDLIVGKMDHVYGLSSVFLEKLKTVDVVIRSLQGAESLVKGFEARLSQEDTIPADPAAIQHQKTILQQWLKEAEEKESVISSLEADVARSKEVKERLHQKSQERSLDVEQYQERTAKLRERWSAVVAQLETRQTELTGIREVLRNYRDLHDNLIHWIETTKSQQEMMKPGQSEDRRVLSEQLSQQTALVAEIEQNQSRLDDCQTFSQQYSVSVKDYELQLMTYKAFVESQQKSPMKRRRMFSSSDVITQEFMDLRTRYTALVTLTTQHVKYISESLRRLEEEEKVLEEEKEKHVEDIKNLSSWVSGLSQVLSPPRAKHSDLRKSISEQKALGEELLSKREQILDSVKSMQIFLAKHNDRLSPEERENISSQILDLKETYNQLCDESDHQIQQLHTQLAREAEQKEGHVIAGVIDLGSMEIFPIFCAMQRGFVDQDTGLMLLEAQMAVSGLIDPARNEIVSLEEAVQRNIIDQRHVQILQDFGDTLKLIDFSKPGTQHVLSIIQAIEEGKIQESTGLNILNISFGTSSVTSSDYLAVLDKACYDKLITRDFKQKLEMSSRNLIDPNTAKSVNLSELLQSCIVHEPTGLRLLPVKPLAGRMVCLKSGKKVSIFSAVQEGLIDRQVAIRLLEAQLFAGGIIDPKTGHCLTVDEATKCNLLDQDLAHALLVKQLQGGGVIDTATGQKVTVDEAVKHNLVSPKIALIALESLGNFRGLLWPESGNICPVSEALREGVISSELAFNILANRQNINGLYVSESQDILSLEQAVQSGILDENAAKFLQSTVIPDIIGSQTVAGSISESGVQALSVSVNRNLYPAEIDAWEMPRNSQAEKDRKQWSHLMQDNYINIHNGQRVIIIECKDGASESPLVADTQHSNSSDHNKITDKKVNKLKDVRGYEHLDHFKEKEKTNEMSDFETDQCFLLPKGDNVTAHPKTKKLATSRFQNSEKITKQQEAQFNFSEDKTLNLNNSKTLPVKSPLEDDHGFAEAAVSSLGEVKDSDKTRTTNKGLIIKPTSTLILDEAKSQITKASASPMEIVSDLLVDSNRKDVNLLDLQKEIIATESVPSSESFTQMLTEERYKNVISEAIVCTIKEYDEGDSLKYSKFAEECNFEMEEEVLLNLLCDQLRHGGIVDANTGQKLLLNEALALGALSSHTALKLMERLGLFSGFIDSQTCEVLTIQDVIDEGLMDEMLLQKVLASDKAISGIVDVDNNVLYPVQDALNIGLIDESEARKILEVQVITGGIYDVKRGKKISVTLASSLNLVQATHKDTLIKLEKACKGKSADKGTKEKLIGLQFESNGIQDPQSKRTLSVVEALKHGVVSRDEAILHLTKQIADGGIIHNISGMRFSAIDALKHGLIDHDLFEELAEFECLNQFSPSESPEDDCLSVQTVEKKPHSTSSPTLLNIKPGKRIPYADILKKCKIDVITGQRFLELGLLKEHKEDILQNAPEAKIRGPPQQKQNTNIPLSQQGVDTIMKIADHQSFSPMQVHMKDADKLRSDTSIEEGIIENRKVCDQNKQNSPATVVRDKQSVHIAPPLIYDKNETSVFHMNSLNAKLNGASDVCEDKGPMSPSHAVGFQSVTGNARNLQTEGGLLHHDDNSIRKPIESRSFLQTTRIEEATPQLKVATQECLTKDGISLIDVPDFSSAVKVSDYNKTHLQFIESSPAAKETTTSTVFSEMINSKDEKQLPSNQLPCSVLYKTNVGISTQEEIFEKIQIKMEPLPKDTNKLPYVQQLWSNQTREAQDKLPIQSVPSDEDISLIDRYSLPVDHVSSHNILVPSGTPPVNNALQQIDKDPEKMASFLLQPLKDFKDNCQKYNTSVMPETELEKLVFTKTQLSQDLQSSPMDRFPLHTGEVRKLTEETPKDSQVARSKQACLEHEENLVSYLSMLRDIEVRLGPVCPLPLGLQDVQEKLRHAEILDRELRDLMLPVNKELDLVKEIVSGQPLVVPKQLLRALEKDAKNLEKSMNSIRDSAESRVKQLSSALEIEKGKVLAEHEVLVSKLKSLLQWVTNTADSLDRLQTNEDLALNPTTLQSDLDLVQSLRQPVADTRFELDNIAYEIQLFISERAQDLTPQQSRVLLRLLNEMQKSFRELSERLRARDEVLQLRQRHAKHNAETKTLQEQQVVCGRELEDLFSWAELTEKAVSNHQAASGILDLSTLQDQQKSMQELHKGVKTQGEQFARALKAAEDFLEENKSKMDPSEVEAFKKKLQRAKEQYHSVLQKTVDTEKQLDLAVSTAVLEETKKSKTAEELKTNLGKIEALLHQVLPTVQSSCQKVTTTDGREPSKSEMSNGRPPGEATDLINDLCDRKKMQHQEMLAQQQNFILTIQSAQDFLDKHGSTLPAEERLQLQNKLACLKEEYATSLSQAQLQLKHAQSLKDELQNFLHDHGEFDTWLQRSEEELNNMQKGKADCEVLQKLLHQQAEFSEDVISHKGDLRYITIAGQKAIEAEKAASEHCRDDFEVAVAGALVKTKLEDASKRYSTLHSKCSKLGSHLNSTLSQFQQFQEGSDATLAWLQDTESVVQKILSEPVASDPETLQTQLEKAKSVQCDLAEHQVQVEKVHKALRALLEVQGEPSPDCGSIQETAESIDSCFQDLSARMSAHSDLLQKSVAQSQSVQEGMDNLLHWLEEMEKTLESQKQIPMSSSSIQESLATNMKLRQDIDRRRGSLDATGEMVGKFMETADSAAAAALQSKLLEVTDRFNKVCLSQSEQEAALKDILPKVERYEQIRDTLEDFRTTRSQLLASGNQPDKDIAQFSEQIQELNTELNQQAHQLFTLEQLASELSTCPMLLDSSDHLQMVQVLKNDFLELQKAAQERERDALSCQDELEHFKRLVGIMRKWLKDNEERVPSAEDSLGVHEIQIRLQQVQDLLQEWDMKGSDMAVITQKGSELEIHIMEITASESQLRGSVLMASLSPVGNVNGYHTCQDLTGIQCDISETSQKYEALGLALKNREEQFSTLLEKMQQVQQEANHMLSWLESKEKVMSAVNVSPTKSEIVKAQAKQNKEFISELEQSSGKVNSLKAALRDLLEKHPNSPEAETWKKTLENLDLQWDRANQVTSERQQKLEESANQLATFQAAGSQLRPWLNEKELMMSVLGPLSIDPNMLNAQKQQVQFMLKEFEARKDQYEELKHAAYGILTGPGDESPFTCQVEEEFHEVSKKWTDLTSRLNSRAEQIDQATVKSTEYQEVLQGLMDKIKLAGKKLSEQPAVSTQPDAVKQQLQETSGIRSDLEILAQEVTEAQVLCTELSALVVEPYLKDELQKRLDTVALPLKGMEDLAADRVNRLQSALANSQQFQQMFDELRNWLDEKRLQLAKSSPVSSKFETLQTLLHEQEEFQKSLNQNSGSYEMIVNEGESLVMSSQPGDEKTGLQNQLTGLKSNWEELVKKATERHSRLKDCLQKAQKYGRNVEDLVPWLEDCEAQVIKMEVTLDPVQLEAQLLRAKALQSDTDKKRSLLDILNNSADLLTEAAEVDDSEILEQKAVINQRMDNITEQLHNKSESIEEMSVRLKELKDTFKNVEKRLEGAKHILEIYATLGPQACSSKNLENMRTHQDMLQTLDPQVKYLKDLIQGLTEDAPEGSDVSHLVRQVEAVEQDFENVKQEVNECCSNMESKLQGIGQFHSNVREMFSQLTDLDDELDNMCPVGRDLDSLKSQTEVVHKFIETLQGLKSDIECSEKKCRVMLENEGGPDLIGLMRELGTLNKQCAKLTERGRNRQEQLQSTFNRVDDFNKKQKELKHQIETAEGSSALQGVVGTEVESIKQQLEDFKAFQKEQVDSLQVKLQQVNGLGQGLIQSADKNCDVHCLEHDTDELNAKWNTLNKKVAERLTQLQEALLHCGKFQDALEPLLSWLTDTEELIANQKPPSAEYKVVKAQIQEQKLLQRLLDDRRATVEMIQAEGVRIADGAEPADQDKINRQLEFLGQRWFSLLQKAQSRQKQLDDILVLAKQFHETTEPIFDWLSATEKKLANSEPIGTQTSKIQQQIGRHKSLEDDITVHETAVCQASKLGDSLSALCSQAEQDRLAQKLDFLQARYSEVQDLCNRKGVLLGQALSNARLFGEDEVEVLNWLSEVEDRLSSVCVKDYKLDALQKQHTDHLALSEEIINRKRNVDQAVKNGQALLKQTTGEEVLLIQEKLDGIKTRYAEITASSGKALRTLEQALQLAGKFQTTHDELTSWLRQVEDELTQSSGQSPAGDQIPQFQQRQKELKKEAMEYRIVLDTINEVGSALLELVPWRAREGLDKLVSDANEQYRSVSTTVGQRVDQIDAAIQRSQQYEQAADAELAWVAETKRKLLALGPICLEQDQTTAQLQVQKAFSVDIIRHKDSIDELLNTQEEILGTCGDGQKASLQEKTEILLQQYEEVSHLNSERYARLEKAQGLVGQFWETYEELNPWIEEMQTLISQLPPPAVDHDTLRQQQEDVRQLRESVSEHKPHIDKLLKIGPLLCELNPEEGAAVREKYSSAEKMYLGIKEDVRKIAMALDDAVAQASQFHDKIGPMLETLENLASRLRIPPLIPAEVEKIRDCISENKNALMELEKLQPSFEALKHRGEELIKRSQGADTDPAAKEIQDKLDQLVFFWEDIKARADEREMKFLDVLELAEKFWLDMGSLLTTIKDTHDIVHDLESPGIDPSMIKQQIEAADSIKEETDGLHEELEFIRILGADLIFACGETEKPEVKKSIDEMNNAWENLKKTWSERLEKLRDAMSNSVQYQDTLQAMFDWLDNAVIKLCDMPPVGTDIDTVKDQLNAMKEFKVEVYQQQIEMEKLNHQGELMLKKAIDDTDRDIIQGPLTELKHLWENLGEKIARRQHKLEGALLALGQFQHALEEVMSWLVHTDELLDAQKPISGDPKVIEVELAKHHVLKNDVLAHESTVQTVNKAGNELLESSARDDANSLRTRLETLNQLWEAVLLKTEEREQQLDLALQQAQGFTGEIEDFLQWQSRIESQLSSAKATGGLPETAREQLQAHMELYAELKAKEDIYKQLLDKGHLMLLSRDDAVGSITEQNVALLKRKWESIANKVEERKVKLEEALALATDFQNSLQEFINWLTQAEQSLNIAPSPSLILDTVLFQIDEHKIFVNEVNLHREQIIELDKTGNQLKFLSQKQDVVLIKNLLLSVLSRWEKVVQRSVDRGRSLDDSRKRAKQFHEAWKKLVDWLEEAENHLDSDMEISNDPDKIKLQLTKHKEFQKTLGSKQPVYDTTVRTGRALKEKALLSDDVQKLDHLLGEVRDKWDTVCGKSVERQHKLEEALLFSGQFMDALQALVDWLYKVEPQLAEDQPVHGDLDLVMNLMDAHKVFQKELGKRTSSVHALKRSARELLESSREDTTWVKVQLQELSTRWDTVCKLSVSKQTRLEQALKQAEEFRSTVHMLLEWLSEAEQTLRFRGALPDDAESLQSLIDVHKEFMKKVEEKHVDVNTAVSMGEGILTVCHPDCITTIKHWITIIRARFEEVLTWGNQHQQRLQAALSELLANSDLLDELLSWIQWAETTLIQRDQEPMPQNIEQVKALIGEHQAFMEEMTQKQPDVDKVTKTYKRKTTDGHGSFNDKTRSRKPAAQTSPPALQLLSQSETKNPRINQLSARWQQVWLLALERQRKLNDALDRLEELKEFANFDFDIWRKKYMRWMNHKKSRVMDFFRRIDKDQDGKITRQEFIDGILASKFPTTKLEMTAVADIFDRDGDGYIDYYEFVAALHPNKDAYRPTTDADKIEDEVTRQVAQCKCAKRFQVEQIGENKYRFFLGNQFGDSQQLRLVRILRSTVMVRVGGGWMALDEFLVKNDPCRARGRTNLELREKFILPEGVSQGMTPFRSRGRRSKPSSRTASPTRSSSSASQSNHSCASVPSSPATPASGSKTPQQPSRCYEKPWLVNSKAGTPFKGSEFSDFHIPSCEVTPAQSSKMKKAAIHTSRSSLTGDTSTPSGAKSGRADPKKSTSRAGSRTGSRASSRRGSDASDFDLLETQSACSDTSESSRRGLSKPSKIPTISKKTASTPKTTGSKR